LNKRKWERFVSSRVDCYFFLTITMMTTAATATAIIIAITPAIIVIV
jgi:hypothetical protein